MLNRQAMHQKPEQPGPPHYGTGEAGTTYGGGEARLSQQELVSSGRGSKLLEQALSRENMLAAWKRVKSNGGSAGADGMSIQDTAKYLQTHLPRIRQELLDGTYRPVPVRRVEIPKPGGGTRQLGIPTVVDRLIQQALLQVLQPLIDPTFSEYSYGFRPNRSAHDAIRQAHQYVKDGYTVVVDIDLSNFLEAASYCPPAYEVRSNSVG